MPKPKEKFPKVFLACPFDGKMNKLLEELSWLPWTVKPANDKITNDHLLVKITKDLKECDFAIFDITGWNANVCLELGLAKGIEKGYYIFNNNSIKKDVPSDIKGIERIDYNWNKKKKAASLFDQLKNGLFKRQYLSAKIWRDIQHKNRADEKFTLILYILSRLKGSKKKISQSDIKFLAKGLNFKKQEDYDDIIKSLTQLKIFKKTQKTGDLNYVFVTIVHNLSCRFFTYSHLALWNSLCFVQRMRSVTNTYSGLSTNLTLFSAALLQRITLSSLALDRDR